MNKKSKKILTSFSERDINALISIYTFRCLTFEQIYRMHYSKSAKDGRDLTHHYLKRRIKIFIDEALITEELTAKKEKIYFLTKEGINIVKEKLNLPTNIYDDEGKMRKRGYYLASELKIAESFRNHQIHLNDFVIDLIDRYKDNNYLYQDEKRFELYQSIRPDGLFRVFNIDFFLEMDMGTENSEDLRKKWMHYRTFINSLEFQEKERTTVVLFIVDGITDLEKRKKLINKTLVEMAIDMLNKKLEFYVDTKDNLLKIVSEKIISEQKNDFKKMNQLKYILNKQHDFSIAKGELVSKYFNNTEYSLYIRKGENNNVLEEYGKKQEYVVEEFFGSPLSVLSSLFYYDVNMSFFERKFGRKITLICVVEDEFQIFKYLKLLNSFYNHNICFTTLERLENKPFSEALFTINNLGNIYHYKDNGLKELIHEYKLKI